MKKVYAPWRGDYVKNVVHTKKDSTNPSKCIFCKQFSEQNDEKNFILKRKDSVIVILNLYPYNAGHLMVIPIKHKASLHDLDIKTKNELIDTVSISVEILKKELKPDGFNIGLNLGQAGGGGIPAHIHMHIVPRWNGDTNFFTVIGDTKAISFNLVEIYNQLKNSF